MGAVSQQQIRRIYAIGSVLGLVGRGTREDDLHALVGAVAGKESVKELTCQEADAVIAALVRLQGDRPRPAPAKRRPRRHDETPGGITEAQQKKVWALMYQLQALDEAPSAASLGERLCGIIRKDIKQDATPERPFAWMTFRAGNNLIEALKKYVANARRKAGEQSESLRSPPDGRPLP